jgi:hypothetical protein
VASAYVYWTDSWGVGRAGLDGSNPNEKFVAAGRPCSAAVNSSHIFWATKSVIYAGNLNGTGAHQLVSSKFGVTHTCSLAIASTHLFWSYYQTAGRGLLRCFLARVDTNGRDLKKTYINEGSLCEDGGIVANGKYLYYLTNVANVQPQQLAIVRVPWSGGKPHVVYHQRFTIGTQGIAVSGGHIFWDTGNQIGRVNLNGSGAKPELVRKPTGGNYGKSCGLAIAGGHLYWGDSSYRGSTEVFAIDSAKLDGSAVNYNLLTGLKQSACVSAGDGLGPPA